MRKAVFVIAILISITTYSQHGRRDGNRIGIQGGVTNMSMFTSNFKTSPEMGWIGGLSVRGNYYNNWSAVFGMQFTESNFSIETTSPTLKQEQVNYTLSGAQIRFLFSYNVVKNHVSVDFGPVLQVNGKLKIKDNYKNNVINGTTLLAQDITDVTKINGNGYLGISAGTRRVRAIIFYQYGINNILNNLNKSPELVLKNNDQKFKGNMGLISGQLLINL